MGFKSQMSHVMMETKHIEMDARVNARLKKDGPAQVTLEEFHLAQRYVGMDF